MPEHRGSHDVRHAEVGELRDHAAEHGADEHRAAAHHLCPPEDRLEVLRVAGRGQRVDQPRLGRAGEEREAEAEQGRCDRPGPERRADVPHVQVQQRREQQGRGAEEEAEAPAAGIGHHAGRDLEEDHADAEERVGREGLRVAQAGVEQEERVDAPDERGGQRRQQRQDEVDALNGSGRIGHAGTLVQLGRFAN